MELDQADDVIDPEALDIMRERGGYWAAYQNLCFDSSSAGHIQFLKVGPDCTYSEPPDIMPDTQCGVGWKYKYIGMVDLKAGEIVRRPYAA